MDGRCMEFGKGRFLWEGDPCRCWVIQPHYPGNSPESSVQLHQQWAQKVPRILWLLNLVCICHGDRRKEPGSWLPGYTTLSVSIKKCKTKQGFLPDQNASLLQHLHNRITPFILVHSLHIAVGRSFERMQKDPVILIWWMPFKSKIITKKYFSLPLAQGNYSTLKLWEIVRMAAKHFSFKIPRYSAAKHGRQTIYQPSLDNRIVERAGIRQTWSLTLPQSLCSWVALAKLWKLLQASVSPSVNGLLTPDLQMN